MARAAIATLLGISAIACVTPACPASPAEAATGEFTALGEESIVAVGHLIRYVNSPELESRGYDIGIARTIRGETSPEGVFLRVERSVPGVRAGEAVMLIAEPARGVTVVPGGCTPLIAVDEAELEPG